MFGRLFGEKSSVDRVVGGNDKEKKTARKEMESRFKDQERFTDLRKREREKTSVERKAIEEANRATDALREKYGLAAYDVPADNIHILKGSGDPAERHKASFALPHQAIVMTEKPTKAETYKTIFHEMTHFKSFASIGLDGDKASERRLGLTVGTGGDAPAFMAFNEAVTEELTKRFMRGMEDDAHLADETEALRKLRGQGGSDEDDVFSVRITERRPDGRVRFEATTFGYASERRALALLIDKLAERNPDGEKSREEWFDMFASAMFNGHLLEIARNVEKAFGKGAFRALGAQNDGESLLKLVESL